MNNKPFIVPIVIIGFLLTTTFNPCVPVVRAMQAVHGNIAPSPALTNEDLQPLTNLLRPDGSLNLTTGFSGSLDPSGFKMSYAPDGSPHFSPKAPLSPANTWNPLGTGMPENSRYCAIAVQGSNVYVGGVFR